MKNAQSASPEQDVLKYREEHISCKNYIADQRAVIQIYEEKAHRAVTKSITEKATLIFLLKGTLHFAIDNEEPKEIQAGQMFLMPGGCEFYAVAKTDVSVVTCFVTPSMALCNQLTLKSLNKYAKLKNAADSVFAVLSISRLLQQELEQTRDALLTGLLCYHYQHLKRDEIFLMLRAFYTKDELTTLFYPILNDDFNFKAKIMQLYSSSKNVNELIEQSGLPASTFNRRFKTAFHTTPNKWLVQKKKESLLNEIRMTDLPLKEIAEEFNFTPNYLIKFCKDHFGQTPSELRGILEE